MRCHPDNSSRPSSNLARAAARDLAQRETEPVTDQRCRVGVWLMASHIGILQYPGRVAELVGNLGRVKSGRDALGAKVFAQALGCGLLG